MNSQMIKPRGAGVVVPTNAQYDSSNSLGVGGRPTMGGMGGQQAISPGDAIKNMLNQSLQAVTKTGGTGGFNWSRYDNNSYEDPALRSLSTPGEGYGDNNAYFVDRVAQAMQMFIQQLYHRSGQFFEEFKKAKESFKFNPETSLPCPVRKTFIEEVDKLHEFSRILAFHGSVFFGHRLINILKETNKDAFSTGDYLESAHVAVRNVLFFELVNWLTASRSGRVFANDLPKELTDKLANLDKFKEITAVSFDIFGSPNPYAALEFKRVTATRPDYSMMAQPMTTFVTGETEFHNQGINVDEGTRELMDFVNRNASSYKGTSYEEPIKHNPSNWNQERNDYDKLTRRNRSEFNIRKLFTPIGKENHYFIPESDWKAIKHAFKKHSEMDAEETVLPGCFRIVIMDLDDEGSGWFSTIVRNERLDVPTILSNPALLLPALKTEEEMEQELLTVLETNDLVKNGSFVEIEEAAEMTKEIPFISVGEEITGSDSKDLEATFTAVNKRLTSNLNNENAVGFKIKAKGVLPCNNPEDKSLLAVKLPMLFRGSSNDKERSLYHCYREIYTLFSEGILDGKLMTFIDTKLTHDFNNWLVNVGGYINDRKNPDYLAVDSILRDFREITEIFKVSDLSALGELHNKDFRQTYLGQQMQMFEIDKSKEKSNSLIAEIKDEQSLTLVKDLFITVINNKGGPLHQEKDVPIVIKRSRFPEIFQMMDKGFKATMKGSDSKLIDKVITFSSSDNMWLFNYSSLDKNVATMRHVSRDRPLVFLAQD